MRILLVLVGLFVSFNAFSSSIVKNLGNAELKEFGVKIQNESNQDIRFNLRFGVPRFDSSKCEIIEIETLAFVNGKNIIFNYLSDHFKVSNYYTSYLISSVNFNIGARYQCNNHTVYYQFGDLEKIVNYYKNNRLFSKI